MNKTVYIVSAVRTPIGSFGGVLKDIPAPQLGGIAIKEAIKRSGIEIDMVDEANQAREVQLLEGIV